MHDESTHRLMLVSQRYVDSNKEAIKSDLHNMFPLIRNTYGFLGRELTPIHVLRGSHGVCIIEQGKLIQIINPSNGTCNTYFPSFTLWYTLMDI